MMRMNRSILGSHGFISFLRYSTPTTITPTTTKETQFMVDYLVTHLGFSTEEAISTSSKVSPFKSSQNPNSVLDVFKNCGFDKTQIKNIVSSAPKILSCDVENNLKPKIRVFQDIGLSGSDLVKLISDPMTLRRGLNTHILPSLEVLKSVLGSADNVVTALKKSSWFVTSNVKNLGPNIVLLRKFGVTQEGIQMLIRQQGRMLLSNSKWLEDLLYRVEVKFRIPRDSPMFIYGVAALGSHSEETLESKLGIFKSYGWTEEDILKMVRGCPNCFRLTDDNIRRRLSFFMNELGYSPERLASNPSLLKLSMEKRVLPRYAVLRVLMEKKLIKDARLKFYGALRLTESEFLIKFVLQYKNEFPDLYDVYVDNICSPSD